MQSEEVQMMLADQQTIEGSLQDSLRPNLLSIFFPSDPSASSDVPLGPKLPNFGKPGEPRTEAAE